MQIKTLSTASAVVTIALLSTSQSFSGIVGGLELDNAKAQFSTPDTFDIEYPNDEEPNPESVALGKRLFFDNRVSNNKSQSCATCHNPDLGFSDGLRFSLGANGQPVKRNTPHLYNLAWNVMFFWDGRSATLEHQALDPIVSSAEMDMSLETLLKRLDGIPSYKRDFKKAFGSDEITGDRVASALASFERTIIVDSTPFDHYLAGNERSISPVAERGMVLFAGKARCILCHSGPNLTDNSFHDIGLASSDLGRENVTGDETLSSAFKVPGLRNILFSAPYMHDGSLGTIEEVVQFYSRGGDRGDGISDVIKPLDLSEDEIRDLVAFLGTLNQPLFIDRPLENEN